MHSTLQLRPQFAHVDTATDLERALARSLRFDSSTAPTNPTARALQATVKNTGDDAGLAPGHGGVLAALRKEEAEEWKTMHWVDQDDEAAWEAFEEMFLAGMEAEESAEKEKSEEDKGSKDGDVMLADDEEVKQGKRLERRKRVRQVMLKTEMEGGEYMQLLAAVTAAGREG